MTTRSAIHTIGRLARTVPVWAAVLLGGCLSLNSPSRTAWRGLDPQAPLGAQGPIVTPPAPTLTLKPDRTTTAPAEPYELNEPTRIVPREGGTGSPRIPRIEIDDLLAEGEIELAIDAPRRKQVGSHVTYRISIRNGTEQTVDDVLLRCQFDEPLTFSEAGQRSVTQRFPRLLPGESKDLSLSLYSSEVGSPCCRFSATTGSGTSLKERASKTVCVEFVDRQLGVELLGPTQRCEGSRAEYHLAITNYSAKPLTDLRAQLAHDQALQVQVAGAGAKSDSGRVVWDLGTLAAMETVTVPVEFLCRSLARRASVSVEVQTAELAPESDEAFLEIVPVPGTLELSVSDRHDPLDVGTQQIYEVTIHNIGLQPARRLELVALLPPQLKFLGARLREGGSESAVAAEQDEQRLVFETVQDLPADGTLTYLIEVEAVSAGTIEFRVSLTSALTSVPVSTAEPTTIIPAPATQP